MSEGATTSAPASACDKPLLDQRGHRHVVHDVTAVVDDAVLSVRRERIERDVGDDAEFRHFVLDRAHGALRQAVGVPGFAAVETLGLGCRDREQRNGRERQAGRSQSASRTSSSTVTRSMPGIDGIGTRCLTPSITNTG